MIPVVNIKWDEAVNPPPNYQVIRYRKSLPTEKHEFLPLIPSGQASYVFTDNQIVESTYFNKLWVYRVISKCADGTTKFDFAEFIKFSCDLTFESNATPTVIDCIFHHMGGDIDRYIIKLYNDLGDKVGEITRSAPFADNGKITGSFIGLTPDKDYTIVVHPIIQGTAYQGECEFEEHTLVNNNQYSIEHTNATPITNIKLYVGNNGALATTLIRDSSYVSSILTGSAAFGFVNANFKLVITHGDTVSGGTINTSNIGSVVDAPPVTTINWSGVNGNVIIKFTTIPANIIKSATPCDSSGVSEFTLYSNNGNVILLELNYSGVGTVITSEPSGAGLGGTISCVAQSLSQSLASTRHYAAGMYSESIHPQITITMVGTTATINTIAVIHNTTVSVNSAAVKILKVNGIDQVASATACSGTAGGGW